MRILIANPFGIGDLLFSLPLIRAIRAAEPDCFIGALCNARTEELVGCWPELNWHHAFEKDEFRRRWKSSRSAGVRFLSETLGMIRDRRFDVLVDLSLGWHMGFAGLLCGIRRRTGFNFRGRGRFLTEPIPLHGFSSRPVADYYLDLLRPLGWPRPERVTWEMNLPPEAAQRAEEYLGREGLAGANLAAVVPGGGASWGPNARYKQWPARQFAQAADHLSRQRRLKILLVGDAGEESLCKEVAAQMSAPPAAIVHVPSLLTLAGILRRCRLVLGNDGGALHLAEAMGTPAVSIFGPVDPAVYGPPPGSSLHRVVAKRLACRPCYRSFRFPPCPWENACLKDLEAAPVLEAADGLLEPQPVRRTETPFGTSYRTGLSG